MMTAKDSREEETKRAHANKMKGKQENLDRKQESDEDTREYYAAKEELWLQAIFSKQKDPG